MKLSGRYELHEVIGHGGMATVYRAWDEKLGREVAVKVFAADGSPDTERRARREREVRLLARADHPHLVTLYDAELMSERGSGFLAMELVRGQSLRMRLGTDGPDGRLASQLAVELGHALAHLHQAGIIHRDLKPENVLLAAGGGDAGDEGTGVTTKLVDFGIAELVGEAQLTTDSTILGTAAYLSPEQVSGSGAVPASDVYALGLVLIECLTGQRAFPGAAVEAAIARMAQDPPMPAGLAPQWRRLLTAMTAREPGDRPSAAQVALTASALRRDGVALEVARGWVDESTERMPAPAAQTSVISSNSGHQDAAVRRRRPMVALTAAAALLTALTTGAAAFNLGGGTGEHKPAVNTRVVETKQTKTKTPAPSATPEPDVAQVAPQPSGQPGSLSTTQPAVQSTAQPTAVAVPETAHHPQGSPPAAGKGNNRGHGNGG